MRVIAFVPSRYDSSRFPGKPMAPIAGMPMIGHVCRRAMSCPEVSEVFVVTDDERILRCVEGLGGKAIMTEKRHRTGTDRIAEASQKMNLNEDDLIVNIQGDQPVFHPSAISDLIAPMKDDPMIPMSTLKYRIRDETESEGFALYFSRSPIPFFRDPKSNVVYYKHLGFYAYRNHFLLKFGTLPVGELESSEKLEQLRALECGFKIRVVETAFDSVEVDTPADIMKAEAIIFESN